MAALFTFSGRLGRLAYLGYSILLILLVAAGVLVGSAVGFLGIIIFVVVTIGGIWASISLVVRRLHDLDMSGWHYLWMIVVPALINGGAEAQHSVFLSYIGIAMSLAFTLFLWLWPGTRGANRFG
jgi:uncharacterized membrane protein YhaH (DUF805 family)